MFAFNDLDYDYILLGKYDFESVPVIIPERHQDPIQILATSEHEQLHDVLARQTTHGILVRLGVRYYRNISKKNDSIYDGLCTLIEDGRAIHEAFAMFSTICSTRAYLPLLEHLTEEYTQYLKQALSIIPKQIGKLRLARVIVYSASLAALSPELPHPVNEPAKCFIHAVEAVNGCQKRWKSLTEWMSKTGDDALSGFIKHHAEQNGYSAKEMDYPLYFEDLEKALPSLNRQNELYKKECLLVENLAAAFGKEVFDNKPKILTSSDLAPVVKQYRDILYPGYRLSTVMIDEFGLTPEEYSEIYKLLHENVHSDLGFEVRVKRNFAKNMEAVFRSLDTILRVIPRPQRIIGYYNNALEIDHEEISFSGENAIEWMIINPHLDYYQVNMLDTLVTLAPQIILKNLPDSLCKRLGILVSPAFAYSKPNLNSALKVFSEKGGMVAQMQPFNFLDFIEWRYLKGFYDKKIQIAYRPTAVKGCELMICKFIEQEYPMIRLVGPSTPTGVTRLNELKIAEVEELNLSKYEDIIEDWINFLRLFWK